MFKNKKYVWLVFIFSSVVMGAKQEGEDVVEIEKLTNDYWSQVNNLDVGVVQNRVYTKKRKLELDASLGVLANNPFINSYPWGLNLGYHINEYFSVHLQYKQVASQRSEAYNNFQQVVQEDVFNAIQKNYEVKPLYNQLRYFYGIEGRASLMYGKISLIGKAIQYFDAYIMPGFGKAVNQTDHEWYFSIGFGQQFHILRWLSFFIEYRFLTYQENLYRVQNGVTQSPKRGTNISHIGNLGLCFFLKLF